jgi:hypothetical protein
VKELEKQDKLRERQEYRRLLRQRREEEEEYRGRAQEAEMMRRLEEDERRQQFLASRMRAPHVDEKKEDEPEQHRVVQGPDERLYRMPVGFTHRDEPTVTKESPRKTNPKRTPAAEPPEQYRIVRGPDESLYRVPASFIQSIDELETEEKSPSTSPILRTQARRMQKPAMETNENVTPNLYYDTSRAAAASSAEQAKPLPRKSSKRVTIIVEDASDSEAEEEFKSVWRNRRPSPGEWMEPVEDFISF